MNFQHQQVLPCKFQRQSSRRNEKLPAACENSKNCQPSQRRIGDDDEDGNKNGNEVENADEVFEGIRVFTPSRGRKHFLG